MTMRTGIPMTTTWHRAVLASVSIIVSAGCLPRETTVETAPEPDPIQALLTAAAANRINMFGERGDLGEMTYVGRSAIPLKQHSFTEIGADTDPDIDTDGRMVVFASTRHSARPDLYMKSLDGVAVTQLTSDPASDVQPAFSPDGTRVAFASDRAGSWDIWILPLNGGPAVQVTRSPADEIHPSWAPGGDRLVYCSLSPTANQWELWMTSDASGGSRKFIGYGLFPEWSPTADVILYQRAREQGGRRFGIWTLAMTDGEPQFPSELAWGAAEACILPTWSGDGSAIAFVGAADTVRSAMDHEEPALASTDIWLMAADGRGKVRLTDGFSVNHAPAFGPDGRLFFTSNRSGCDNIWSLMPSRQQADEQRLTDGTANAEEAKRPTAAAGINDDL